MGDQKPKDTIQSVDQLDSYIRVANPSIWLGLGAIVIFLIGIVIWGIFGTIQTTIEIPVEVTEESVIGYLPVTESEEVSPGDVVMIENQTGKVESSSTHARQIDETTTQEVLYFGSYSIDDYYYPVTIEIENLEPGVYEAKVVVESIAPIYFLIH